MGGATLYYWPRQRMATGLRDVRVESWSLTTQLGFIHAGKLGF